MRFAVTSLRSRRCYLGARSGQLQCDAKRLIGKVQRFVVVPALIVALLLLPVLGGWKAHAALPVATVMSVAQLILRGSINVGVDRTGEYLLGSQWPVFRTVMGPILGTFPDLLLDSPDKRQAAVEQALEALRTDERLRQLINDQVRKLGAGMTDLWIRVDALQTAVTDHERRLAAMEAALQSSLPIALPPAPPAPAKDAFKEALYRFIKEAGPSKFAGIKGPCMQPNLTCERYESGAMLPGARTCYIKLDYKTLSAKCELFESGVRYYFGRSAARMSTAAEIFAKGKLERTAIFSPSREEALLAFVEMVDKIDDRLPSHWKRSFPGYWWLIMEPKNWPYFYQETNRDVEAREESAKRFEKRTWDEFDRQQARADAERSYYIASEPGGGREVRIEYSVYYIDLWEPATRKVMRNQPLANVYIEVK